MLLPTMLRFGLTSICNEANCGRLETPKRFIWPLITFHIIEDSKLFASRLTN